MRPFRWCVARIPVWWSTVHATARDCPNRTKTCNDKLQHHWIQHHMSDLVAGIRKPISLQNRALLPSVEENSRTSLRAPHRVMALSAGAGPIRACHRVGRAHPVFMKQRQRTGQRACEVGRSLRAATSPWREVCTRKDDTKKLSPEAIQPRTKTRPQQEEKAPATTTRPPAPTPAAPPRQKRAPPHGSPPPAAPPSATAPPSPG